MMMTKLPILVRAKKLEKSIGLIIVKSHDWLRNRLSACCSRAIDHIHTVVSVSSFIADFWRDSRPNRQKESYDRVHTTVPM